ncbi:guanylate cyclase 32E-like [Paramacrobiotus metropolitanus]|uniref:guanylate cyclase 32E-like n=1 Tax=Paramacrobiotus metropolitanus TaxID=2943436 RepID=UPI0024459F49|nr:guanylate cyclase 32E-like [Paramacrobiotus metropolitanus]
MVVIETSVTFTEIVAAITHEDSAHRHSLRPTLAGHDISKLVRQALQACWSSNPKIRPKMRDLRRDIYGACKISPATNLSENLLRRFDAYIHELEVQLQERTDMAVHEINLFQQRLYDLWPKEIAVKIWNDQSVHSHSHEDVTILYGDVVDFEEVIEQLTPNALFHFLQDFALVLNQACAGLCVMKIELLGASYIYCSGIVTYTGKDPVLEICKAANNIREYFTSSSKLQWLPVHIRIGISTGPCISGVIDPARPRYRLLGSTLKFARTLCHQGDGNGIYLTTSTAERLMERHPDVGFLVTPLRRAMHSPRFHTVLTPAVYVLERRAQTSQLTPDRALMGKGKKMRASRDRTKSPAVHTRVSSSKSLYTKLAKL